MQKLTLFLGCSLFFLSSYSQDIPVRRIPGEIFKSVKKDADTSTWKWKRGGLFNANLSQGTLSNWAAGGDEFSMAVNTYVNYYLLYREGKRTWDNTVDFNFGFVQASSIGGRKNDDRIEVISKYGYKVDSINKWYLSGLFNFRTQFFDGNTYDGGTRNFTSTLLSPAYILLSAGMDYKPSQKFSMFLSPLTARWVIVANSYLANKGLYGVDSGKHSIGEVGAFASFNYATFIGKNVAYKGKLDMFSNYRHKPGNVDVYFTNFFSFKINRMLSASYTLDIIYDDDVKILGPNKNAARTQIKSLIGIGFQFPFYQKKV
jgi:hypothetical protein